MTVRASVPHVAKNPQFEAKHHRGGHGRFGAGMSKPKLLARDRNAVAAIGAAFAPHHIATPRHAAEFTAGHRRRIRPETVTGFHDIAKALRKGDASDERIAQLDAAMEPTVHDLVLTRRMGADAFGLKDGDLAGLPELLAGRKIVDKAYTPAALHQEPSEGGITLHIAVPKGTRALVAGDNEMWLDRDLELAVGDMHPNGRGGYDVEVTVLPKGAPAAAKKTATAKKTAPAKKVAAPAVKKAAPEPPPAPAPAGFEQRMAKAFQGEDALHVAPVAYEDGKLNPPAGARWTKDQRARYTRAAEFYQDDSQPMNSALRQGRGDPSHEPGIARVIADLDETLSFSKTDRDLVAYRGIQGAEHLFPGVDTNGNLTGLEWLEHGYASTTADPGVAREFSLFGGGAEGGENITMRMLVPAGTPAAQLSAWVGHTVDNEGGLNPGDEAELLLAHGLRFRVVADHGISDEDGLRHWDVEVVGERRPEEAVGAGSDGVTAGRGAPGGGGKAVRQPDRQPAAPQVAPVATPKTVAAKPKAGLAHSPAEAAQRLKQMSSTEEAGRYLAGATKSDLAAIADEAGIFYGKAWSKKQIHDVLVHHVVGRRLSSEVISRPQSHEQRVATIYGTRKAATTTKAPSTLAERVAAGESDSRRLGGGLAAVTSLVTFADGSRAIKKVARENTERPAKPSTDAEYLSSTFGRALGIDVPEVLRTAPNTAYMNYIPDAKTATERFDIWGAGTVPEVLELAASDAGRRLGLFDLVIGNHDRNPGNWLIDADGKLHGIDHGMAFLGGGNARTVVKRVSYANPFTSHLFNFDKPKVVGGSRNYSLADIEHMRRALASVEDEFKALGRSSWYRQAVGRLDWLAEHADGEGTLFA